MARKRAKINEDLFAATSEPEKVKEPEKTRLGSEVKQTLYYIPVELKEAIARRATDLGIPASQLVIFLLSDGLRRLDAGETDPAPYLTRSQSPRFRHNLELADWYYAGDNDIE